LKNLPRRRVSLVPASVHVNNERNVYYLQKQKYATFWKFISEDIHWLNWVVIFGILMFALILYVKYTEKEKKRAGEEEDM